MESSKIKEMSPFSLYDIFGYLIPGLVFCFLLWAYFLDGTGVVEHHYQSFTTINSKAPAMVFVFVMIFGSVITYSAGHAIAMVSHLTIDRLFIGTVIKYPSIHCLKIDESVLTRRQIAWPMHKCMIVAMFVYLLVAPIKSMHIYLQQISEFSLYALVLLIFARIVLLTVKGASKKAQKWELQESNIIYKWTIGALDSLLNIIIVYPLCRILQLDKPIEEGVRNKIKEILEKKYFLNTSDSSSDLFWIPCLAVLQNQVYNKMINNWLHLFGLMRNLAAAILILCFIFSFGGFGSTIHINRMIYYYSILFLAVIFMGRYLVLYYAYYSKMMYRMFYAMEMETEKKHC